MLILDPGHGGDDPGITTDACCEKILNLALARRIAGKLSRDGYPVRLTRDADLTLSAAERVQIVTAAAPDLFLSIHQDCAGKGDAGTMVIYSERSDGSFARELIDSVARTGMAVRGILPASRDPRAVDDYRAVWTAAPAEAAVIRFGCLDNGADLCLLGKPAMQEKLANAVVRVVRRYLAPDVAFPGPVRESGLDNLTAVPVNLTINGAVLGGRLINGQIYVPLAGLAEVLAGLARTWKDPDSQSGG